MKQGEKAAHVKIEETYPGIRTRLNTTANGKLSSRASLKNEYRRSSRTTVSKKTENTIGEPEELYAEIERIRERGYAIDDEERFEGMRGISAPLMSEPDETVSAIGIYGPTNRLTDDVLHETFADRLLQITNVIQASPSPYS